jgi:hypothetical protein
MQLVQPGLADVAACNSLTEWERPNIVARALFKVNAHFWGLSVILPKSDRLLTPKQAPTEADVSENTIRR